MRKILFPLLMTSFSVFAGDFQQQEVKVFNSEADITLAGTLTFPTDITPKAVVVLATGSGLQNRDEELFGHRPFKVIAETLSSEGFAVLRMDDRGFGESEGETTTGNTTTRDFSTDINAGLVFLDSCYSGIPKGVIGHSEGGIIAIMLAAKDDSPVDFIVTLAGPAWSGDSIIMSQSRALATRMTGRWDGESVQRKSLDIAESDMPAYQKQMLLYQIVAETLGEVARLPEVQTTLNSQAAMMVTPWYYEFLLYDPSDDIKKITVPWLALNGSKDVQVLPENLTTIRELNTNAETVLLSDHNHLFQECTTGLPQEYPTIMQDISPITLQTILSFLNKITDSH